MSSVEWGKLETMKYYLEEKGDFKTLVNKVGEFFKV